MAQALTYMASLPRIGPRVEKVGVLLILLTFTTETYAAASGGITVDLTALLAEQKINFGDVLDKSSGISANGHVAILTKTATAGQFTVELFVSAGTEITDGAITQAVTVHLQFAAGGV